MRKLIPLFILAFSFAAFGQTDLPDIGSLADIKGKTKVYIVTDAQNLKQVLKGLKDQSTIVRVDRPDDADFFMEYKEIADRKQVTSLKLDVITGQMDVYFYRDKRKVVAWSESKAASMKWPSLILTERFVKEFTGKR